VCGRTARTVRRAGTAKAVSDPYRIEESIMWRGVPPFSFSVGERKVMNHFVVRKTLGRERSYLNINEELCRFSRSKEMSDRR
jgi:hypothetical protein